MNHYAILTGSTKFLEVAKYITENNLDYEVHLNRTRFWVPDELLSNFINKHGEHCDFVPENQDLMTGRTA